MRHPVINFVKFVFRVEELIIALQSSYNFDIKQYNNGEKKAVWMCPKKIPFQPDTYFEATFIYCKFYVRSE